MVGCNSGRATPFLRRNRPSAIPNHQPRRNATYHSREAVQTTEASSVADDREIVVAEFARERREQIRERLGLECDRVPVSEFSYSPQHIHVNQHDSDGMIEPSG